MPDENLRRELAGIEIVKVRERYRLLRWLVAAICIVIVTWIITSHVWPEPWWKVVLALLFPAGSLAATVLVMIAKFRGFIRSVSDRVQQLEQQADPRRSSSGIDPDGTAPHDD